LSHHVAQSPPPTPHAFSLLPATRAATSLSPTTPFSPVSPPQLLALLLHTVMLGAKCSLTRCVASHLPPHHHWLPLRRCSAHAHAPDAAHCAPMCKSSPHFAPLRCATIKAPSLAYYPLDATISTFGKPSLHTPVTAHPTDSWSSCVGPEDAPHPRAARGPLGITARPPGLSLAMLRHHKSSLSR
jgi:hypothetical protein